MGKPLSRLDLGALLSCLVVLLLSGSALAQQPPADDNEGAEEPPKPVLTPPRIKQGVSAVYPPEALKQGLEARVELEVLVAPDGTVQEAKVVSPVGHGFDEAALTAIRQFTFVPAMRDDEPIPARIRYPILFEFQDVPQEPEEPEPDKPPPPAVFEGRILATEDDEPLSGVKITLSMEGELAPIKIQTDETGSFRAEGLPPGLYMVRLVASEYSEISEPEQLRSGEATEVIYRMQKKPDSQSFGALARVDPPPREVTRRSIGKKQLTRIPGTRGDALRTVELMPGVGRPAFGAGQLIVRGSSPTDTQTLLEGLPVQLLYHFGGLTSFINSHLLEGIEFYPGNFSVRYGRRRGGIVEVQVADPPRDQLRGVADINLIDTSLLLQAPLTDNLEFAAAARRSYVDLFFEALIPEEDVSAIAAPVYYDYQAFATYRPSARDKLRLMVYGSSDEFRLLFTEPPDNDATVAGNFDFTTEFHRAHVSWRRRLSDRLDQDVDLAVGLVDLHFGLGSAFDFRLQGTDVYGRSEWRWRATDKVRLIGGLDMFVFPGDFTYEGPPVSQQEGNPENQPGGTGISDRDRIVASSDFTVLQPAVYIETDLNLHPIRFVLGSRIDYFDAIEEYTFDPRMSAHYSVTDDTRVKGGVGMFSQPPDFPESSPALGNPDLKASRTIHLGTGVDHTFFEGFSVSVDGFYKFLYRRVVGTEFGESPLFTNDGDGRVYGLELSGKVEPRGRFFGYLSYTLSRSQRRDRGGPWRLFDFDQTHILTLSGVYRLGRGWEAGATFRLVSGNPETPIVGASYGGNTGNYVPIYGLLNSRRTATFNRLDVRVEKLWEFSGWKLALYLDVQNAYNEENSEGKLYDYEFVKSTDIRGLPIIPNLGIRGEI